MNPAKWAAITFAILAMAIVSAACSPNTETPTTQPDPTATQQTAQQAEATESPTSDQPATDSDTIAAEPIELNVLFPADGETLATNVVRVLVEASLDSQIDINGFIAAANLDGSFFTDLVLEDGINFIEITGINLDGSVDSEQLIVFVDLASEQVTLSIVSPQDGAITPATSIGITGITSVDSVVQVNGVETTPNSQGIFAVTIELESGSNLIEIIVINLLGESVTEELVIFSQPE